MKPKHTPHIDLQEKINTGTDTVQIVHSGGEAIDLSAIKIILSVDGEQTKFNMSKDEGVEVQNPDGTDSTEGVLMLGDRIVINTYDKKNVDLKSSQDIDMFFLDMPSQQVIQRVTLQCGNEENPGTKRRYWITPSPDGTATDTSGGWISIEAVNESGDGIFTVYYPPDHKDGDPNSTAQTFDFNIDATKEGISTINKVTLEIVYSVHDANYKDIALDISVEEPEKWIRVGSTDLNNMPIYKQDFGTSDIDLTPYVKTIDQLQKFKARIVIVTQASEAADKKAWIDFLGIHVD